MRIATGCSRNPTKYSNRQSRRASRKRGTAGHRTSGAAIVEGRSVPARSGDILRIEKVMNNDIATGQEDHLRPVVPIESREIITVEEAASHSGISRATIKAAIRSGELQAWQGRGRRLNRVEVEEWAKNRRAMVQRIVGRLRTER